jgi:hypothetical protein
MLKIRQLPQFIFVLILITSAILGVLIAKDYGISWDEISEKEYGWDSLSAYEGEDINWERYNIRKYYGPFYLMFSNIIARNITRINDSWDLYESGHYINYLMFLLSGLFLYLLLIGITSHSTSLITTTLFFTQPLLFGHAFINHKDIPFMTLFLAAITFGMFAYRRMKQSERQNHHKSREKPRSISAVYIQVKQDWKMITKRSRIFFVLVTSVLLIISIDLFITNLIIMPGIQRVIVSAYDSKSWSAINRLFMLIAKNSQQVGLDEYLSKLQSLSTTLQNLSALAISITFIVLSMWSFPSIKTFLWDEVTLDSIKIWAKSKALPFLFISAIASGLATSVRPLGFLAFMLVGVLLLYEFRSRGLFPLMIGTGTLLLTSLVFWPALWGAPLSRFWESLTLASNHPWRGVVLYRGDLYVGGTLPWHYLPTLLLSQFTEPVYIFIVFGIFVALSRWKESQVRELAIVAVWFLFPILTAILSGAVLFDNFRQFLFVIPALFVIAGVGINSFLEKVNIPAVKVILTIMLILPGLIGIIKLHPYEYVYYNAGVGGVKGAFRRYELDYWGTSYLEAFEFINQELPEDTELSVWGPDRTAMYYARPDLQVVKIDEETLRELVGDAYILLPTRRNIDLIVPEQIPELWSVKQIGIPLAVIYTP